MTTSRKLVRNFSTLLGGNVLGQFLFFLGFAYLARILGPSEFGLWNFAQVCMLYLLRVGEFGLEVVGIREVSRNPHAAGDWTARVVSSRLALAMLLFGLAAGVAELGLLPDGTSTLVVISALTLFPMALLLEWVYEAHQEVGLISFARILKGLLFLAGVFLVMTDGADTRMAASLYVGSVAIPGLVVLAAASRRFGFSWKLLSLQRNLEAIVASAPIGIATLLSQFSLTLATILVGYLLTKEELGYFTAAHRIVLFLWAYVITSLHRVLLPGLSRRHRESQGSVEGFVGQFFRLAALGACLAGMLASLSATPVMEVLYSDQYRASGPLFGILIWGFVLASIRTILEIALIASDRERVYMKGIFFLSVVYGAVTPVLTIGFGTTGAAAAIVGCEGAYLLYLMYTSPVCKLRGLLDDLWRYLVAAGAALATMTLTGGVHPILAVVVGTVAFILTVSLVGGIRRQDIDVLWGAFSRG